MAHLPGPLRPPPPRFRPRLPRLRQIAKWSLTLSVPGTHVPNTLRCCTAARQGRGVYGNRLYTTGAPSQASGRGPASDDAVAVADRPKMQVNNSIPMQTVPNALYRPSADSVR